MATVSGRITRIESRQPYPHGADAEVRRQWLDSAFAQFSDADLDLVGSACERGDANEAASRVVEICQRLGILPPPGVRA